MKIKDIPFEGIRKLAISNSFEKNLNDDVSEAFSWTGTKEGHQFWSHIDKEMYDKAREIHPHLLGSDELYRASVKIRREAMTKNIEIKDIPFPRLRRSAFEYATRSPWANSPRNKERPVENRAVIQAFDWWDETTEGEGFWHSVHKQEWDKAKAMCPNLFKMDEMSKMGDITSSVAAPSLDANAAMMARDGVEVEAETVEVREKPEDSQKTKDIARAMQFGCMAHDSIPLWLK